MCRLLQDARSFRSRRLLALLSAEDPRLPQRMGATAMPNRRLPYLAYLVLQVGALSAALLYFGQQPALRVFELAPIHVACQETQVQATP